MEKVTIVINGVGGSGKDSLIDMLMGKVKFYNVSTITPVKEIAMHCGWKGEKTDRARKFLADLKKLMTDYNDYPTNYVLEEQDEFIRSDASIIFVHIREPEEIAKFVSLSKTKTYTLLILPRAELQGKVYGNSSDDNVANYPYDFTFANDKPLDEIEPLWLDFVREKLMK